MMHRFQVLLWHSTAQRHETLEVVGESASKVTAYWSQQPDLEVRAVTRMYGVLNPAKEWLNTQEACEHTGWSRWKLNRLVNAGDINPSNDNSGFPLYRRAELDSFIATGKHIEKRKAA